MNEPVFTCARCRRERPASERRGFDDRDYCPRCLDAITTLCHICGARFRLIDNTFNWTLDLSNDSTTKRLTPSRIAQKQYYETLRGKPDPTLDPRIREPKELFSFTLTAEDAAAYCASIGIRFFRKKWHDKTVIISL